MTLTSLESQKDSEFEKFYEKNYNDFVKYTNYKTSSSDSEDIVQNVFLSIFRFWDNYKPIGFSRKTWAYCILRNQIIDFQRKIKVTIPLLPSYDIISRNEINEESIYDSYYLIDNKIDLSEFKVEFKKLPKRMQKVILLKYEYDLSVKEIADFLHIKENLVRMDCFRGREKLKKSMRLLIETEGRDYYNREYHNFTLLEN